MELGASGQHPQWVSLERALKARGLLPLRDYLRQKSARGAGWTRADDSGWQRCIRSATEGLLSKARTGKYCRATGTSHLMSFPVSRGPCWAGCRIRAGGHWPGAIGWLPVPWPRICLASASCPSDYRRKAILRPDWHQACCCRPQRALLCFTVDYWPG